MSATNTINRISRDTILYIPVFLAPALINIILLMVFTRFYSPVEYGTYTIAVNITIVVSSLLAQWIVLSVQRYRPEYKHVTEFNRHLHQLLFYISLSFLLVASILYLFMPVFLKNYYWPSALFIITSIYFMVLGAVYQVDLEAKRLRNLNVAQSVLKLAVIVLFVVYFQMNPVSFIWGAVIAQLVVILPMFRYVETPIMVVPSKAFAAFVRKLWRYGFPLIGWYIGTTFMNLTDRFMLEYFRSSHEVGIYSANFTIAVQAIALIGNPLFFAIQPIMMNEIQQYSDKHYIEQRISGFTRLFIRIAMPLGVYFSIYRSEVSELLLGKQFTSGAVIIPILIVGFFAWNLGLYGQLSYQIGERTKELFYFVVVAAICNVALNLFFIPKWGFIGAAVSTSIGFIIYCGLLFIFSGKRIRWKIPWRTLFRVTLVVMVFAIPTILVKMHVLAGLPPLLRMLAGLPYFLLYFITFKKGV
jgi:O-antigen/teichoic acid export membrane protein